MSHTIDAIAEGITPGQIGKISELLSAALRKNASTLPSNLVQEVLQTEGAELVKDFIVAFQTRTERCASMIVRHVTVNRKQIPKEAVHAFGRIRHINDDVLATIPKKGDSTEEVDVYFFKVDRCYTAEELDKEYEYLGLIPDPYAQAQVNQDDPAFADNHPNGSQWNREGKISNFLTFSRRSGIRVVDCDSTGEWGKGWWVSGVRK